MSAPGVVATPLERKYSDPIAVAFGGAATLIGLFAAWQSLKAQDRRSLGAGVVGLGLGLLAFLRGLGVT